MKEITVVHAEHAHIADHAVSEVPSAEASLLDGEVELPHNVRHDVDAEVNQAVSAGLQSGEVCVRLVPLDVHLVLLLPRLVHHVVCPRCDLLHAELLGVPYMNRHEICSPLHVHHRRHTQVRIRLELRVAASLHCPTWARPGFQGPWRVPGPGLSGPREWWWLGTPGWAAWRSWRTWEKELVQVSVHN